MRRLRLLFVPREPWPTTRVDVAALFGRELAARGHVVDLVAQRASGDGAETAVSWTAGRACLGPTDDGGGFRQRLRKRWLSFRHDLEALPGIRADRYDAVVVRDKFLYACVAVWVARRRGVAFVYWLSFPYPEFESLGARTGTARYPWAARLLGVSTAWMLYRWILPRADHALVQSERMADAVAAHGIPRSKLTAVPMGVDAGELPRIESPAAGHGVAEPVVAYLGTLSTDRRLDVLVDAFRMLVESGSRAHLLLIGDAERERDRAALEAHVAAAGLAHRVRITGFLPHRAALELAAGADVCVSPIPPSPIFDVGSPTKLIEYLALAKAVVANAHPEQRQVLAACRAGVCVPWGARHFARGLAWLLERDAAERSAMGARGRAYVLAARTYARIADDVERALAGAAASRRRPRASTRPAQS